MKIKKNKNLSLFFSLEFVKFYSFSFFLFWFSQNSSEFIFILFSFKKSKEKLFCVPIKSDLIDVSTTTDWKMRKIDSEKARNSFRSTKRRRTSSEHWKWYTVRNKRVKMLSERGKTFSHFHHENFLSCCCKFNEEFEKISKKN